MTRRTIGFILIAATTALLGFGGVSDGLTIMAKITFFIFIMLFLLSFLKTVVGKQGDEKLNR